MSPIHWSLSPLLMIIMLLFMTSTLNNTVETPNFTFILYLKPSWPWS